MSQSPDPRPHPRDYEENDRYLREYHLPDRRTTSAGTWITVAAVAVLFVIGAYRIVRMCF